MRAARTALYILLCGCTLAVTPACAVRVRPVVMVDMEPPADLNESAGTKSGYVWVKGKWEHRGGKWLWRVGRWERVRKGYAWRDGQWERRGSRWHWVDGHWAADASSDAPQITTN